MSDIQVKPLKSYFNIYDLFLSNVVPRERQKKFKSKNKSKIACGLVAWMKIGQMKRELE